MESRQTCGAGAFAVVAASVFGAGLPRSLVPGVVGHGCYRRSVRKGTGGDALQFCRVEAFGGFADIGGSKLDAGALVGFGDAAGDGVGGGEDVGEGRMCAFIAKVGCTVCR